MDITKSEAPGSFVIRGTRDEMKDLVDMLIRNADQLPYDLFARRSKIACDLLKHVEDRRRAQRRGLDILGGRRINMRRKVDHESGRYGGRRETLDRRVKR